MIRSLIALSLCLATGTGFSQKVSVVRHDTETKVTVLVDDAPFTTYFFPGPELLKKPVLYPVYTANGTLVTRGWPLNPRPGERVDHPHHVGIWFNYEAVNGNDFWNNSTRVNRPGRAFGTIVPTGITSVKSGTKQGELTATADWIDSKGTILLKETSRFIFRANGKQRIIDQLITLTAVEDVDMPDIKDGMFAIRVARELELPYSKAENLTDANGIPSATKTTDNRAVGSYRNSNGIENDSVWAKKAVWCQLSGVIGKETVSVSIIDHPENFGYPSYWHARGYGLFAVNPLGQHALDPTKSPLNFKIPKGQSAVFRFRVVIDSQILPDRALNQLAADFARVR